MPYYRLLIILTILVLGALAGTACSNGPVAAPGSKTAPEAAPAATASPARQPAMPAHVTTPPASTAALPPETDSASPAAAPTAGTVRTATGKVLETMDAGGSTYLRLDTGTDNIWVATSKITVKTGDRLAVPLDMPMRNFRSGRLGRDFPLIYFANSVSREGEASALAPQGGDDAMPAPQGLPAGHPPIGDGASSAAVTVAEVIRPAAGGYCVADLWARRAELAGKAITVRGKIVKFRGGILGRNWMHLQDGSGKTADGTNDITVTSTDEAAPGDIVTATGTLALDRDFGAGYRYGVIVEGATLSK
jgi:hypothetical protein